jgi:hypothetical protein
MSCFRRSNNPSFQSMDSSNNPDNSDKGQQLLDCLKSAIGMLNLAATDPLRQAINLCDRPPAQNNTQHNFRILVFAPFNYGKSTLLNAILGERTLPIDLIPTTGASITVRYGAELRSQIHFKDGRVLNEAGTELLKQFAILDGDRRMREDVQSVEVYCPHPFLQTGVELVDLPGTDDREAQDTLVKQQLLTADLVIQVLDGRKLMTLQERENLRDWLLDRGIETVLLVVNFLNLLEPEEQKQVYNRLRFVAESFRANLPNGVSNLYRVDALPALRARLKGDAAAVQTTGLPIFESALQTIVQTQGSQTAELRLPRIQKLGEQVQHRLEQRIAELTATTSPAAPSSDTESRTAQQKLEIQQRAQQLIQKGFAASLSEVRDRLNLTNLITRYQYGAVDALRRFEFRTWEQLAIAADWTEQQQALTDWVIKACNFFNLAQPAPLKFSFPPEPEVIYVNDNSSRSDRTSAAPVAIATGLGWVFGGPIGAAILGGASYIANEALGEELKNESTQVVSQAEQAYEIAVRNYLSQFRTMAIAAIERYELETRPMIQHNITIPDRSTVSSTPSAQPAAQQHELNLLNSILTDLRSLIGAS